MSRHRRLAAVCGLAGLATVGTAILHPRQLPSLAGLLPETIGYGVISIGLAALTLGYVGHRSWTVSEPAEASPLVQDPPELVTDDKTAIVGESTDQLVHDIERAYRNNADPPPGTPELRTRLQRAAIETFAEQANVPKSEARATIEAGDWTDNRRAAAYLAEAGAVSLSAFERLYDWVTGRDHAAVRANLALEEIERLETDDWADRSGDPNE